MSKKDINCGALLLRWATTFRVSISLNGSSPGYVSQIGSLMHSFNPVNNNNLNTWLTTQQNNKIQKKMELKQLIKLQTARQRPGVLIGSSELKCPCRRDSASSLRLISAAVVENNEVASSYQMTFSLDPFTRGTYKACTNNAAEARPVLSWKSLRKEIGTRMIRIRFLAPREGKKGNGCSFPNPLLLNVGLIRKV